MSETNLHQKSPKPSNKKGRIIIVILVVISLLFSMFYFNANKEHQENDESSLNSTEQKEGIENGIHKLTGLKDGEGLNMVIANCTGCHSAKIIIQNRMDTAHWNETIKWMQETQNLWDLGENQDVIVNYLVTNYPQIENSGRRSNLTNVEWYELEDK